MDAQEIRALLGKSIFERAQKYRKRILQSSCTTNEDGVRHLTALVQGSGPDCYYTQVWLRENGSFVSAPATAPIIKTATAPTVSTLARCCCRTRKKIRLLRKKKPESIFINRELSWLDLTAVCWCWARIRMSRWQSR